MYRYIDIHCSHINVHIRHIRQVCALQSYFVTSNKNNNVSRSCETNHSHSILSHSPTHSIVTNHSHSILSHSPTTSIVFLLLLPAFHTSPFAIPPITTDLPRFTTFATLPHNLIGNQGWDTFYKTARCLSK